MNHKFAVWASPSGLIISVTKDGYLLEDPLSDEPIQLCDEVDELKRIVDDIESNPFKVGDKVRVKKQLDVYKGDVFDTVHYVAPNGAMCLMFYEEGGISACAYTWNDLIAYGNTQDVAIVGSVRK